MRDTDAGRDRLVAVEERMKIRKEDTAMQDADNETRGTGSGTQPNERGTGSDSAIPMSFAEKRKLLESGEARVVTQRVEDLEMQAGVKRRAEELEREKARARLLALFARIGCGLGPYLKDMPHLAIPAVCDLRAETWDDKPKAVIMLAHERDMTSNSVKRTIEQFSEQGGLVAVAARS
eukprot:5613098-Amphidinium_carterae.2